MRLVGPLGNTLPTMRTLGGATLRLDPLSGALPGGTTYTVALAPTITDVQGLALGAPYARTFSTAPQTWNTTPDELGALQVLMGDAFPAMAVDPDGNVFAAWVDRVAGIDTLFVARRGAQGTAWTAPQVLHVSQQLNFGSIHHVRLAAGRGGHVVLLWAQRDFDVDSTHLATWVPATASWSASMPVTAVRPNHDAGDSWPVVDSRGNVTVITAGWQLYVTQFDRTAGTWSPIVTIEADLPAGPIRDVRIVVDANDNLTAAWVQFYDPPQLGIFYSRFDAATGMWSRAGRHVAVDPLVNQPLGTLSMAVDATGVVTMAWPRNMAGMQQLPGVEASRFDPATDRWSTPRRLDSAQTGAYGPTVVVDAAGNATVAWVQLDGLNSARWSTATSTWSPAVQIHSGFPRADETPAVTVDVAGNVTVMMAEYSRVYAARYDATAAAWRPSIDIARSPAGSGDTQNMPVAVVDATGTIDAMWFRGVVQGGQVTGRVTTSRFR